MKKICMICLSAGLLLLLCLSLTLCGCQISQATLEFAVSDATIQDTPYFVGRQASVKVVTTCEGGILYDSRYTHGIEGGTPTLVLPDGTVIQGVTETTADMNTLFMRKGDTVEYWWSFDVPEDFPAGTYTVTVAWFGSEQTLEGVEFVMTDPMESPSQSE
jgi:hypothetical protein